jgi:hypothetical protein
MSLSPQLLSKSTVISSIESRAQRNHVDTALSWGPGLRWGIMGNMMIEHFFQQFAGPMVSSWKALGSPVLTPEVQKKLIDGVHAEVGSRTVEELEAERDEILLGLLELRTKRHETAARHKVSAE